MRKSPSHNPVTADMIRAINADTTSQPAEIIVTFINGRRVTYTAGILDILKTDPTVVDIIDANTGEVIYAK